MSDVLKATKTLLTDDKHPHGYCECSDCAPGYCAGFGPAAFLVERDCKDMRVCTKCDFSGDKNKRLLVTDGEAIAPFMDWDPIGGMCIVGRLTGEITDD